MVIPPPVARAADFGDIVISEIFYYTTVAQPVQWVELYNPTNSSIDISGWVLTDDSSFPTLTTEGQCAIPATTIVPALGFVVIAPASGGPAGAVQCTPSGTFDLANAYPGDNLALFDGPTAGAQLIYGTLGLHPSTSLPDDRFNYETIAASGQSIALKDPMAGWSGNKDSDWSVEASPSPGSANAVWQGYLTTNHTITLDGDINVGTEWLPGELLGAADGVLATTEVANTVKYYVTWDADNIFVGMIYPLATDQQYVVMVDTDPYDTGANNSGVNTVDQNYCNTTFDINGKPDYALQYNAAFSASSASGGVWQAWVPSTSSATNNGSNTDVEFQINKSEIGLSSNSPVGLYLYVCQDSATVGEQNVIAAWPPENQVVLPDVSTSTASALTTRVVFESTSAVRSPRDEAARIGYQTRIIGTATYPTRFSYFDEGGFASENWYVSVNINAGTPSTNPACQISIKVIGNDLISRGGGGIRRSYDLTAQDCPGLAVNLSMKYEDGNQPGDSDVNNMPGELRGMDENALTIYHFNGSTWDALPRLTGSSSHNRIVSGPVSSFSAFSFGYAYHEPNAINLSSLKAQSTNGLLLLTLASLSIMAASSLLLIKRRKHKN